MLCQAWTTVSTRPQHCWQCVAAVVAVPAVYLLLFHHYLAHYSWQPKVLLSMARPQPQPLQTSHLPPPHPALDRGCYTYQGVWANNTCCKTLTYDDADLLWRCAKNTFLQRYPNHRIEVGNDSSRGSRNSWEGGPGVHWALVGDSHLRYLFDVLLQRLSTHQPLQYRDASSKNVGGGWRDARELLTVLRYNSYTHDIEVRHARALFYVTWYFDPLLQRLPDLVGSWLAGVARAPALMIIDSGLHWMRITKDVYKHLGQAAAIVLYRNQLRKLAPMLTRIAAFTPTVYKLLDDIQDAHQDPQTKNPFNTANIEEYNQVTREELDGTGVVVWDSTLPLSLAYTEECRVHPRTTDMYMWKCSDRRHVGYIIVEQYADMLLNHVCNTHVLLDINYCA